MARKVELKLCIRTPSGEIKCKDKGLVMEFEKGTVGPTSVKIEYPE